MPAAWRRLRLYGVVYTLSRTMNYADNDGNPRIPLQQFKELITATTGTGARNLRFGLRIAF